MKTGRTRVKSGALAAAVLAAGVLLTAQVSGIPLLNIPGLPSFGKMLEWFFLGGEDVSPSLVNDALAEGPLLPVLYLIAAVIAVVLLVAAFRLLLPRGKETAEANWDSAAVLLVVGVLFVFFVVINVFAYNLFGEIVPAEDGLPHADIVRQGRVAALTGLVTFSCTLVLLIFFVRHLLHGSVSELGFYRKSAGWKFLTGIVLFILLFPAFSVVRHTSAFFLNGLGVAGGSQAAIIWITQEPSPWFDVLAVFNAVVIAAVCEEALFRGFLLRGLKRVTGGDTAIILSAALFALGHDSIMAWLPIFSFGLILGYVYDRTGSLWVPIGFHAAFNAFTMTILLLDKHHLI